MAPSRVFIYQIRYRDRCDQLVEELLDKASRGVLCEKVGITWIASGLAGLLKLVRYWSHEGICGVYPTPTLVMKPMHSGRGEVEFYFGAGSM